MHVLPAGDVPGQEPRECGDVFWSPWQLVDGGRCDLGSKKKRVESYTGHAGKWCMIYNDAHMSKARFSFHSYQPT